MIKAVLLFWINASLASAMGRTVTTPTIMESVSNTIVITVNNVNEPPTLMISNLPGRANENAPIGFEVAVLSCADDPEMSLCGSCAEMKYGCSGNAEHSIWGQSEC